LHELAIPLVGGKNPKRNVSETPEQLWRLSHNYSAAMAPHEGVVQKEEKWLDIQCYKFHTATTLAPVVDPMGPNLMSENFT